MDVVDLILRAEAAQQMHAVRSTLFRHRHLHQRPFIICVYNLSGEAAAPLGIIYGQSERSLRLAVAPEPRNRDNRFEAINKFAAALAAYLKPFKTLERQHGQHASASDAPQIVVPNSASASYLTARLGRSLRYTKYEERGLLPMDTLWAGADLAWFAEQSHLPGQSVLLPATALLGRHYATGQSPLEDENLASLMAWIENDGTGLDAIHAAEDVEPFGPVPHPRWEAQVEPLIHAFDKALRDGDLPAMRRAEKELTTLIRSPLRTAWRTTRRAVDLMLAMPAADSVHIRWKQDVRSWSTHCRRAVNGIPRFSARHDAALAHRRASEWTNAHERLVASEALDDPLVLAHLDAQGLCCHGRVTQVDVDHFEVKPGKIRSTVVPLVSLELKTPTNLLPGTTVRWTADSRVQAVIRSVPANGATGELTVAVTAGHAKCSRLPVPGTRASFLQLDMFEGRPPNSPESTPWTHRRTGIDAAGDHAAINSGNDSPDMSPEELADLPTVGTKPIGDVPGVVL